MFEREREKESQRQKKDEKRIGVSGDRGIENVVRVRTPSPAFEEASAAHTLRRTFPTLFMSVSALPFSEPAFTPIYISPRGAPQEENIHAVAEAEEAEAG